MKRVLIDTDGEFDDAMALILAHKSRDLKVEAITTLSGIRNHRDSTDNVLNTVELLNCDFQSQKVCRLLYPRTSPTPVERS